MKKLLKYVLFILINKILKFLKFSYISYEQIGKIKKYKINPGFILWFSKKSFKFKITSWFLEDRGKLIYKIPVHYIGIGKFPHINKKTLGLGGYRKFSENYIDLKTYFFNDFKQIYDRTK
jgi:hypothetical protein